MTDQAPLSRYSSRGFPSYRHIPGRTPHPTRDPQGHSYGQDDPQLPDLNTADWRHCDHYLYGIDLFNAEYWWEAHEVLEGLWRVAGIGTPAAHVLQAVIQCAAAQLKTATGRPAGAHRLLAHAKNHVLCHKERRLGLDLVTLLADTGAYVSGHSGMPARLAVRF